MVGGVGQIGGGIAFGSAAALFSAADFAGFTVAVRWGHLNNMLPAGLLGCIFAMVAGGIAGILTGQPLAIPPVEAANAAGMGTVTLTGGMFLYIAAVRSAPSKPRCRRWQRYCWPRLGMAVPVRNLVRQHRAWRHGTAGGSSDQSAARIAATLLGSALFHLSKNIPQGL